MAKQGCGQVSTPTVDNTELECDSFTSSKCVKVEYPFGITISNLNDFFELFEKSNKELKKSYTSLKGDILNLKQELKQHKTDINVLKKRVSDLNKEILILKNNN